jgi:NMD protein affecting ribosome stability and mRNA decay
MKDRMAAPAVSLHRPRRQPAHDVYGLPGKLADPTACSQCGAVYHQGRWTWRSVPFEAARVTCPACRRTTDRYPAGILSLGGAFVSAHRHEIESCLLHVVERDRAEHPLKRIIAIEPDDEGGLRVTTTDGKLARALGTALRRAYRGTLEQSRTDDQGPVRVQWCRD